MSDIWNSTVNTIKQLLCKHTEYTFVRQKFMKVKDSKQFKLLEVEGCKNCRKERLVEII